MDEELGMSLVPQQDAKGRFLPGNKHAFTAGHPRYGGRQQGLAAKVRALTRDGDDIVEFMYQVFQGQHKASLREQMEAAQWLADRGFGKVQPEQTLPPTSIEVIYVDKAIPEN